MRTFAVHLVLGGVGPMNGKVLFTIGNLEYPFSEGTRIGPENFELVRDRIETSSELGNPR